MLAQDCTSPKITLNIERIAGLSLFCRPASISTAGYTLNDFEE